MKHVGAAAGLVGVCILLGHSSGYAGERILLTPAQTRIYHRCLTDDWIEGYCRTHAWGAFASYDRTYAECIAAEHHGRFVVNERPASVNMEAYCWHKAHGFVR